MSKKLQTEHNTAKNNTNIKTNMYILTCLIDIYLIADINHNKLDTFDFLWIISVIACHIIFYISLYKDILPLIDFSHYYIFIALSIGIFLKSYQLNILCLLLLLVIQILWIVESRCILNDISHIDSGFSDEITLYTFALTTLYSVKITLWNEPNVKILLQAI